MSHLSQGLLETYALLRGEGGMKVFSHVYVDRVDFCSFGNSQPFRVRIVNAYNENQDYFYVKVGDASRVCGLELEHLLSPNRMLYLTWGETLVEEHVTGIPGDIFAEKWLDADGHHPVRLAKELIKFEERCLVRLLGDMRAYNFVIAVTPDFDATAIRVRAMDFDQQSYEGRLNLYKPQFFKDNAPLALFCAKHLRIETARQYQREEQVIILQRAAIIEDRLAMLLAAMSADPIAPPDHVRELREGLADFYKRPAYLRCESMGALVRENLESIRLAVAGADAPVRSGLGV
jgi:hypothetical protein